MGSGKSTAEMQSMNTFIATGWDFNTVWQMFPGDYPRLQWEVLFTPEIVIDVPGTIFELATGPEGAWVSFTDTAEDGLGNPIGVTCNPPSGSLFPLGCTLVTCTATDGDRVATATFIVVVTANLDRAAGAWITAAEGGTVSTADGSVTVIIPAGALSSDTLISIAESGTSFKLVSDVQVSPMPVPVSIASVLTAVVDDSTTGETAIGAADYRIAIDDWVSDWFPMDLVTGGGWILSPEGAFHPELDELANGR
jgi:hypothetical protein